MKKHILLVILLSITISSYAKQKPQSNIKDPSAFITTWKTITNNETITIYTHPKITTGYNYTIDWGDGIIEKNLRSDAIHQYISAGKHTVQITGDFPAIYSYASSLDEEDFVNVEEYKRLNRGKLQSINNWGAIVWERMDNAFARCENLT